MHAALQLFVGRQLNISSLSRCWQLILPNKPTFIGIAVISSRAFQKMSQSSTSCSMHGSIKLYYDKGNPFAIKLLAASHLSDLPVAMEVVKKDKIKTLPGNLISKQLPVLEVGHGEYLQSTNAACRFLLSQPHKSMVPGDLTGKIDELLEWDSCSLSPVLTPYLVSLVCSDKPDPVLATAAESSLLQLEKMIGTNAYVLGDKMTLADVVLWGSVYGALRNEKLLEDVESKCPSVVRWFEHLCGLHACAEAVTEVLDGQGISAFKECLSNYTLPAVCGQKVKSLHAAPIGPTSGIDASLQNEETTEGPSPASIERAKSLWMAGRKDIPKPRLYPTPILPCPGEKNILITSALPYVNNVPHLGNIIGCCLSADVYSRYLRLRNVNTLFICGTDEYGTATETKAIEEGLTPQQICDKYHKIHASIYSWFNIKFDFFGRTTTQKQTEIAQDIFWKCYRNGNLLEDSVEQLRCVGCDRFLADRFVEGTCPFCNYEDARGDQCDACGKLINAVELKNPRCKVCRGKTIIETSKHLFLDLPKLEPKLRQWLDRSYEGNWTHNAKHITKGWLADGLKPRCITRDLKWGTPVPLEGFTDKVFYVWFDAPIGYLSITANYTSDWEKWWKNPEQVTLVNFMAKDNVPFHTVIFPSSLLGTNENYTLLNSISSTEYLNYEEDKFSKSRGVGVFGDHAADTGVPADIYRFYLLHVRPESQDSAFSWSDFVLKNNTELLNNLGNFVNRALTFLKNSFDSTIPALDMTDEDYKLVAAVNNELTGYIENLDNIRLRDGLRSILAVSRLGNQYMQANTPWVLVKGSAAEKARAATIIGLAVNLSGLISVLLMPYMPQVSEELQSQLALPPVCRVCPDHFAPMLPSGHRIGQPSPLFQKIEPATAEALRERFAGKRDGIESVSQKANAEDKKKAPSPVGNASSTSVGQDLEEQVRKQGDVVRDAKSKKLSKDVIDAEVKKLLELKSMLAASQGQAVSPAGGKEKSKKKKAGGQK